MIFYFCISALVCMCDMQNAFDGIVESGQKEVEEVFMALHYTSDKLQFFVTRSSRGVVFPMHILSSIAIYMRGAAMQFTSAHSPTLFFPSIHLFPGRDGNVKMGRRKGGKIVYIPNCCRCSFSCSTVVFLHFWQTHIHMCAPSTSSMFACTTFYFVLKQLFHAFLRSMQIFSLFAPRRAAAPRLVDSEMVIRFGLVGCVLF
jgi:hypothetical protein